MRNSVDSIDRKTSVLEIRKNNSTSAESLLFTIAMLFELGCKRLQLHFDTQAGGSAVVWMHFFWIFGHPEVYVLVIPAFAIVSEIVPVFSRKAIFGYPVIAATICIGFIGMSVWAHHMFTVGMSSNANTFFVLSTMAIAVPTGIKIFNGLATMWGGKIELHDMDHYADDLAALTAHLDLKDAIHVGHSTGGGEMVHYLARHGESRVAKAAIISCSAAPDAEDRGKSDRSAQGGV
jgi:heme/copper-type cytochrome/quinol oxidase subunit 1